VPVSVPAGITWAWITSGYSAVTFGSNAEGTQGTVAETDAQLRSRWLVSYAVSGAGTVDSMITAVLALAGTTAGRVYENTALTLGITSPVIISSLPAKSFVVALVTTATAAQIASTIWDHKPIGIESWGSSSGTVVDAQGVTQTVYYEPATALTANIVLTVTGSSVAYDAAITAAIVTLFAALTIGDSVIAQRVECAALDASGPDTVLVEANINAAGNGVDLTGIWNKYPSQGTFTINHV